MKILNLAHFNGQCLVGDYLILCSAKILSYDLIKLCNLIFDGLTNTWSGLRAQTHLHTITDETMDTRQRDRESMVWKFVTNYPTKLAHLSCDEFATEQQEYRLNGYHNNQKAINHSINRNHKVFCRLPEYTVWLPSFVPIQSVCQTTRWESAKE